MSQNCEPYIGVIKSRFDNTIIPEDVKIKLSSISKIINENPIILENKLRQMIKEPEYIPFHTTDDMYRTAVKFLTDNYKSEIRNSFPKSLEFFVIAKGSTQVTERIGKIYEDHPADLKKLIDREKKNKERVDEGQEPREYSRIRVRRIATGETAIVEKITVTIYGIFNKFGLFKNNELGNFSGDLKTSFAELILEGDDCRLVQNIECGKTYKINYCDIYFDNNHYTIRPQKMSKDVDYLTLIESKQCQSIKDMVYKLTKPIDISEITEKNIGSYKVIHGIVDEYRTFVNRRDNQQGSLKLTSLVDKSHFNVVWWNNPFFATQYITGTEVYLVCDIKSDEKYGLGGIGHVNVIVDDAKVTKTNNKVVSLDDLW